MTNIISLASRRSQSARAELTRRGFPVAEIERVLRLTTPKRARVAGTRLTQRTLAVARHEAAHAVANEVLGNRVLYVRINSWSNGECAYGVRGKPDPLVEGIVALAGHAADIRWRRVRRTIVPKHDHECVLRLGFRGRSLPTLLDMSRALVGQHAETIDRIARRLIVANLSGRQVRAEMRKGPTQ